VTCDENLSFQPHFFLTPQKSNFIPNYESKTSINVNRIFEKSRKHLSKFCDIETEVSTVYFSKNPEIMVQVHKWKQGGEKET
jgi:hypothetical protein